MINMLKKGYCKVKLTMTKPSKGHCQTQVSERLDTGQWKIKHKFL